MSNQSSNLIRTNTPHPSSAQSPFPGESPAVPPPHEDTLHQNRRRIVSHACKPFGTAAVSIYCDAGEAAACPQLAPTPTAPPSLPAHALEFPRHHNPRLRSLRSHLAIHMACRSGASFPHHRAPGPGQGCSTVSGPILYFYILNKRIFIFLNLGGCRTESGERQVILGPAVPRTDRFKTYLRNGRLD